MADTGIGAGLPAVDASAAARKGAPADRQDAAGDKASFGSALERARDGNDRSPADARHADDARSRPTETDKRKSASEDDRDAAMPGRRPAIDIRMTGRASAQTGAATATGQPETSESLAAGQAGIARLPKNLRPAGQDAPLSDEADSVSDEAVQTRPHAAGDEKTSRVRKGQKTAGADPAHGKAAAGKSAGAPGSAEADALILLQAADGAEAAPTDDKAAVVDKALQSAAKSDVPLAALAAHVMPDKAEAGTAKPDDGIGYVGSRKGGATPQATEDGEGEAKTDAPAPGGRTFRFSRADGRGQRLDMVIGDGGKETGREPRNSPVEAVTVVDSRRYLALSQNSNTIVSTLGGDAEWTSAMQPSSALSNAATMASTGKVVNTLKIQINTMTLGTVTATMRLAGDELSVDLAVETVAAYRQLTDDQRGLVDSLRAQGFAVDQVTVTLVSPSDKTDSSGTQTNGQNAAFGQQAAQDGGASPRRDDRHAAQQNWRGGDAMGDDTQTRAVAGPGGAGTGALYI